MAKQNKKATYTQEQVARLLAEVFTELVVELEDPSLVIAGTLAMKLLAKKLKQIFMWAGLLKLTHYQYWQPISIILF